MLARTLSGHLTICEGQILWADEDAHQLLGYPVGALIDLPFSDVCTNASGIPVPARGGVDGPDLLLKTHDGSTVRVDARAERMDDFCVLWSFSPVARGARAGRIDFLARHDALTRLPNRIPAVEELRERLNLRDGRLLAVCYLDIDRFRDVNDRFGPMGGDTVLREVARRLKAGLPHEAVVARVGGDEFALAVSVGSRQQCENLVAQLLARLAHPFRLKDDTARLRASVGVALMADAEQPTEVMLQHAQHAVFFAKRAGGSQLHFFDASQALEEQESLELRRAMAEGMARGEFWLAYQPKVDMRCGRVIGAEALIRWQHPQLGLLSPAAFMDIAEESPFMIDLGAWVFDEACRQLQVWNKGGSELKMSINVSARQFADPNLSRIMESSSNKYRLDRDCIKLEVTESMLASDLDTSVRILQQLRSMGFRIALDDFGTGYSNFSYLTHFPVTTLKIDRSFILNICADPNALAILKSIIALAKMLDLRVICEGIETQEQLDILRQTECDLIQGYFTGRPVSAEDFVNQFLQK